MESQTAIWHEAGARNNNHDLVRITKEAYKY